MPRRLMGLHAVDAEWMESTTVCLLIRCEDCINGFREIIVAAIARLHLRLLYRLLMIQLINDQYHLGLQHQFQHLLVDFLIVTYDME